jgi:hypothetical protein
MWNTDHIARSGSPAGRVQHPLRHVESRSAVDRIPQDRCIVCDETVQLHTDGNGRLVAFDRYPRDVHRHPEAVMGEAAYRRKLGLPDGPTRDPSEAEAREIVESTRAASQIARAMGLDIEIVRGVLRGEICPLPDVDYEEVAERRRRGHRPGANGQDAVQLTDEEIRDIVYSLEPTFNLASRYSISPTVVSHIRTGKKMRLDSIDYEAAKEERRLGFMANHPLRRKR